MEDELKEWFFLWQSGDKNSDEKFSRNVLIQLKNIARPLRAHYMEKDKHDSVVESTTIIAHEVFMKLKARNGRLSKSDKKCLKYLARNCCWVILDQKRKFNANKRLKEYANYYQDNNINGDITDLAEAYISLERSHPLTADVLRLKYFGLLRAVDIQEVLDLSNNKVFEHLRFGKVFLDTEMQKQ